MSGRIYDIGNRPICPKCKLRMVSSRDNNWNGPSCGKCGGRDAKYLKEIDTYKRISFIGKILGKDYWFTTFK